MHVDIPNTNVKFHDHHAQVSLSLSFRASRAQRLLFCMQTFAIQERYRICFTFYDALNETFVCIAYGKNIQTPHMTMTVGRGPSLVGERKLAAFKNNYSTCSYSDLVLTWPVSVLEGEMWFTQNECVVRNPGWCFLLACLQRFLLVSRRFNCRLFGRR